MGWNWGHMNWWGMGWAWIFVALLLIGIVVLVVVLTRVAAGGGVQQRQHESSAGRRRALEILDERYARGEIDSTEYDERRRALGGGAPS